MYAIMVLTLVGWLGLYAYMLAANNMDVAQAYRQQTRVTDMRELAAGIDQYSALYGAPPATLDALTSTAGFEYLRAFRNPWQGYVVSGPLTDGAWTYTRSVLVTINGRRTTLPAYLADNRCGTGGASSAPTWCGAPADGRWSRWESRTTATAALSAARLQLNRSLQLFADYYSAQGGFPDKAQDGTALTAGSVTALVDLAGFAGTSTTCRSATTWQGIPLSCDALFDRWGGHVGYAYMSPTHMALVSTTPLRDSSGTAIVVVADFDRDK